MATCNPSTLQANGKDFYRLSARDQRIVKITLLRTIAGSSETASQIMERGKEFYRLSALALKQVADQELCNIAGGV